MLGIVNAVGSSIARACDGGIYLHAGPEITVVATKTFVSTLLALMTTALQQETAVKAIAEQYSQVESAYFVVPNPGYGIAMEGALKRFEFNHIHAEAYAAYEVKHDPLALISPTTPTVFVLPDDDLLEKNLSTIKKSVRATAPARGHQCPARKLVTGTEIRQRLHPDARRPR